MKTLIGIILCASLLSLSSVSMAQEKKKDTLKIGEGIDRTAKKVGHATASTAKKVGNGTASTASKLASKISDKQYKGKTGPDGQTVYIDKYSKYYYVDSKGKKIYLEQGELKDKP